MHTRISILNQFPFLRKVLNYPKSLWLVSLCVLFIVLRLIPIWGGNFAFQYDNAKDSLLMLDMWVNKDPVLTGPTTSIPGLFYGPGWYYLALPLNILMNFHPLAGVTTVWLFGLLNVYLLYKYVNPLSAFLYTISVGIVGTHLNAWTPYMTLFVMVPAVIILLEIAKAKKTTLWQIIGLASCTGLMFHAQVAYAIVFLPIVLFLCWRFRAKFDLRKILVFGAVFSVFLFPSLLFELTHDWLQTKAVLSFVQNYSEQAHVVQPNQPGLLRVVEISWYMVKNASQAVLPWSFGDWVGVVIIGITVWWLRTTAKQSERQVVVPILLGTWLLYFILPAKEYYFVALTPVWIYAGAQFLIQKKQPLVGLTICFLVLSFFQVHTNWSRHQGLAKTDALFFSTKQAAIEKVYQLTEGKPFSSYHFTPEVYDYTYQHLFLRQQFLGRQLPIEFSYAPGESSYIPYKTVPINSADTSEYITLIVEPYFSEEVFQEWWNRVTSDLEIIKEEKVNQVVTVYVARKKSL